MRAERGLLYSDPCTLDKLKRFVLDKHLQLPESGPQISGPPLKKKKKKQALGRRQMINLWKHHDDHQTFDRLQELPAELQSLVAAFCMDFATPLSTPPQPPLARTNCHLRELTLPISYGTQKFALPYIDYPRGVAWNERDDERSFKLRARGTCSAIGSLAPHHLTCIKSLYLISDSVDGMSISLDKSKAGFGVMVADFKNDSGWLGGGRDGRAAPKAET